MVLGLGFCMKSKHRSSADSSFLTRGRAMARARGRAGV